MEYFYPNYYKQFQCVAGNCEDTCCAGWQIVIDPDSLEGYRQEGSSITTKIDFEEEVFCQDENKRCAFLNRSNLCDLYTLKGKDALCYTCKSYPRVVEEFEGYAEISVSMSCPEVAKILLDFTDKMTFYNEYIPEQEPESEAEPEYSFLDLVYSSRELVFEILQDRSMEIDQRIALALDYVTTVDAVIAGGDPFAIHSVEIEYTDYQHKPIPPVCSREQKMAFLLHLQAFEVLKEEWAVELQQAIETLNIDNYEERYQQFLKEWDLSIIKEQLMVYYVFMYYALGSYDGFILSKFHIAVSSVYVLEQLWFAQWLGGDFTKENQYKRMYQYARELEHSADNVEKLESFGGK